MKKIAIALSLLTLTVSTTLHAQSKDPAAQATADLEVKGININDEFPNEGGEELYDVVTKEMVNLNTQFNDNGLLVVFTCNTCPFVIKAQQRTNEVIEVAQSQKINIVFINSNEAQRKDVDSKEKMKEYATKHNYANYLVDENSQWANTFGATKTPEVFLFNADRLLVYKGAMDDNPSNPQEVEELYLQNAMHAAANGGEISPNTTKSIGCSIKRK